MICNQFILPRGDNEKSHMSMREKEMVAAHLDQERFGEVML